MVGIETTESRRAAASWAQRTRLATCAAVSLTLFATASTGRADVLMQRYDKGRTGATVDANISPSSFSDGKWQRLKVLSVDGAVYAQPLFLQNKLMSDGVVHDVVYIATARNKLYAFDADTFQLIWQKQPLIPGTQDLAVADISDELIPGELGALAACAEMSPTHLPANGDTSASAADYGIGIQSTPVLDPTAGTNGYMYFAFRSNLGSGWATSKQYIAKMDLKTGTITSKEITPSNLEGQPVSAVRQRASLLLNDGIIYVAFASHCEERSEDDPDFTYHGILLAIDAGTLNVVEHFDTVEPGVIGGGIWQASSGIAADDNDNLFFMTGNALPTTLEETNTTNMPNAFVKVHATNSGGSVTFSNVDFFRPWRAVWQDKIDLDLGAAGVLLPPGSNQVVGGGKEGILYVLNRNNLGQLASGAWDEQDIPACAGTLPNLLNLCEPTCSTSVYPDSENAENVVQKWPAAVNMDCTTPHMNTWLAWPHIHAGHLRCSRWGRSSRRAPRPYVKGAHLAITPGGTARVMGAAHGRSAPPKRASQG